MKMFGDSRDSIKAGEVPQQTPPRPKGVERNVVISQWDWAMPKEYFHDEISTDRRNPSLNANGYVYGVHENSSDFMTVLDPNHNSMSQIAYPVRDPKTDISEPHQVLMPSPYWGDEPIFASKANVHSLMMDSQGRIWSASVVRPPEDPAFCKKGSSLPSAQQFPLDRSGRQTSVYDPKTKQFGLIDLCFGTQHLMFAEDANNTLWFSNPGGDVVGWLNTKMYDQTHDEQKSQGWTPLILDTNGNGKRDDYVEPDQPVDPTKDKRVVAGLYSVSVNPVDGTVWGTSLGYPGYVVRVDPGPDPTHTALAEIYEPPFPGYGPRGGDIDRNGVFWASLASGHLASFDRKKCKVLNGPTATGKHCPEGWTLYPFPGPQFKDVTESGSAEASYYTWVDQFDTFGLGKNVPIATGNLNDALLALVDGKFVVLRVPYPLGYYTKCLDGRIDDAGKGWKGRGLWSTTSTRAPFHMEGGKGTRPKVVRFQLRPNPLAE